MTVRRATSDDVPRIAAVLAHAFAGDPPMRWVMGASPHAERRLAPYFRVLLSRLHMPRGEVWVSDEPTGAAAWIAPGEWPPPQSLELALAPVLLRTFGRHPLRASGAARVNGQGHPAEPHWYLPLIAVEPTKQGHGYGSALLRYALERVDREKKVAYLESTNPSNIPLYQRHGFEVVGTIQVGDAPPLFPMVRQPR